LPLFPPDVLLTCKLVSNGAKGGFGEESRKDLMPLKVLMPVRVAMKDSGCRDMAGGSSSAGVGVSVASASMAPSSLWEGEQELLFLFGSAGGGDETALAASAGVGGLGVVPFEGGAEAAVPVGVGSCVVGTFVVAFPAVISIAFKPVALALGSVVATPAGVSCCCIVASLGVSAVVSPALTAAGTLGSCPVECATCPGWSRGDPLVPLAPPGLRACWIFGEVAHWPRDGVFL
jgi:hypothetical protein